MSAQASLSIRIIPETLAQVPAAPVAQDRDNVALLALGGQTLPGTAQVHFGTDTPAGGVPVGTLAIGKPGAINAALLAAAILALSDPALAGRLRAWRKNQSDKVLAGGTLEI